MVSRQKQPLSDITERFQPMAESSPASRPKRRAKAPKGTLGEKIRAKAIASSSLPPSSPAPQSSLSHLPLIDEYSDRPRHLKALYGDPDDTIPDQSSEFHNSLPAIDIHMQGDDADEINAADPFGFFVAEEELKTQREALNKPPSFVEDPVPHMPPTPHKSRILKRLATRSPSPSPSPSPIKHSARVSIATANTDLDVTFDADDEANLVTPKVHDDTKKVQRKKKEIVDPTKLGRNLEALLPKRRSKVAEPTTRRTRSQRGKQVVQESESDSDDVPSKPPKKRRATKKRVKRQPSVSSTADDHEDEKVIQERKARLEYYKSLENYEVAKENVYLV